MLKMIMIMLIIRIDATQISFRTGQLSLSEKKAILPPPPLGKPTQHINFV